MPDRDSVPYWEGLRQHQVIAQRCKECGRYRWPLRAWCNACMSWEYEQIPLSGKGRIRSWVVVHRAHIAPYSEALPYNVVLVELDEQADIVIPGNMLNLQQPIEAGMEVEACFVDVDDELTLLRWRPV